MTPEIFRDQIIKSIDFLRSLKAAKKEVKLKLYPDAPLLKMAVLDDYIWIQHYHTGLDVQRLPEDVFKHDQNLSSLYFPFYQYFMTRWNDPNVPEYDLDSDELFYRDSAGNEIRREMFGHQKDDEGTTHDLFAPGPLTNNKLSEGIFHSLQINRGNHTGIKEFIQNVW